MRSQSPFPLPLATTGTLLRGLARGAPPRRGIRRQIRQPADKSGRWATTASAHDGLG